MLGRVFGGRIEGVKRCGFALKHSRIAPRQFMVFVFAFFEITHRVRAGFMKRTKLVWSVLRTGTVFGGGR